MKLQNHAVLLITIAFILGIFCGFQSWASKNLLIAGLVFSGFAFLFLFFRAKKQWKTDFWFPSATFLVLFFVGFWTSFLHLPQHNPQHYLNQSYQKTALWKVHLQKKLTPTAFSDNYLAKVVQWENNAVEGKILVHVLHQDSVEKQIDIGDFVLAKTKLQAVHQPLNPGQFNYRYYLAHRGVFGELNLKPTTLAIVSPKHKSWFRVASNFRKTIQASLLRNGFSTTQTSLMQALLLGQKKAIPQKIYENFAAAGVVHILAVSGLHIGIILAIFFFFLQPLLHFPHGRLIRSLVSIVLLWGYAILAGCSPSILRAVVMFSCISLGLAFQRKPKIMPMLCLSALLLLLYHPYYIFDIGFQLSYTAVIAIITLQPKLAEIYRGHNYLLRKAWTIFTVTLAAQGGVLPFSLYYFHQFPGLFFLTNFLLIPGLALILGSGFIIIILALSGILPHFLVLAYGKIINSILWIVQWVAGQDAFVFQHVYFSKSMLLFSYLVLLLFLGFLYRKKKSYLFLALTGIVLLEAIFAFQRNQNFQKKECIVFHHYRGSLLGFRKSGTLSVFYGDSKDSLALKNSVMLTNYETQEGIFKVKLSPHIKNVYALNKKVLLVVDSLGVYELPKLRKGALVLLRNSPQINLERLLDSLQPTSIIADGSNYTTYVHRWKKTCSKKKVPFHFTGKKGAFFIDY